MKRLVPRATLLSLLWLSACSNEADGFALAAPNAPGFQSDVYPVLLRDCGFPTCHGASERLFRVWGPGRVRLDPLAPTFNTDVNPVTGEPKPQEPSGAEAKRSLESALGFIDAKNPKRSLLLRKPLSAEAGGTGHLGVDRFGRNVYRSTDSDGYLSLSRWVFSLKPE